MPSDVTLKILDRIGEPGLFQLLTDGLTGTELNSLLLDVLRAKAKKTSAPSLLKQYQLNRFVKPADLPVIELRQTELDLLRLFQNHLFEPIELSPVSIFGSCSAVSPTDQNNVLSAYRGTEVLADATNAMALHICDRKKRGLWQPKTPAEKLRLSTIQRHVRTQTISTAGFTPHFKIGCFVTSGMDTGDFTFEKEALLEHLQLMNAIYNSYYGVQDVSFRFLCRMGYQDSLRLAIEVKAYVQSKSSNVRIDIVESPEKDNTYYKGLQYKIDVLWKGKVFEIADGGFVDWTQKILQNKKERFLIGGIGFEFMFRVMNDIL